jgi:alkanesulfonate monooxygenase SsuD/methylene tetrahydromethanopterin reductase-like flavin-dependent oxidoreductase (luciferase family)
MKVSIFNPMAYTAEGLPSGWPAPGRHWDPATGSDSMRRGFELFDVAAEAGFDWLTVAEHHYHPKQLAPSPAVMAAAISQRYPDPKIAVLGVVLPITNPIRSAEELAMVDAMSGGRLVAGLLRGLPNEFLTYGTNAVETRAMFGEALELVRRAWTEPEPFGWEGRHYRYRTISVWPRPVQQPLPPILLSGVSDDSAAWAGRQRAMLGLSFLAPTPRAAQLADIYRASAGEAGWNPTADDILYRARIYVAETDERAEADARRYELGDVLGLLVPPPERADSQQRILGAVFGGAQFAHHPPGRGTMPEFYGSPDTVARQLREASDMVGWGVADLIFTGDWLPQDVALRSLRLFCDEVLPQLRG